MEPTIFSAPVEDGADRSAAVIAESKRFRSEYELACKNQEEEFHWTVRGGLWPVVFRRHRGESVEYLG